MSLIQAVIGLRAQAKSRQMQSRAGPLHRDGDQGAPNPINRSASVVIAVTLQRLIDDASRFWSVEERLVLDALRRSAKRLNDASVEELSAYVSGLTAEQLRGVASNVKGIYHELLFVHAENFDGDEISARVFEATNHPGADVEFVVDGEVIRAVQLKAVASVAQITRHLERYPDIDVLATVEVATGLPNVASSGFSNLELKDDVASAFEELPGDSLIVDIGEGVATSALLAGAMTAGRILRGGSVRRQEVQTTVGDLAIGGVAAVALEALL